MAYGPIELVVIGFPGNKFKGEIIPELKKLVENDIIRIIDFVFVMKDDDGQPTAVQMSDYDSDAARALEPIIRERSGMINDDDVDRLMGTLDHKSSAVLMLFENVWATDFVQAVLRAEGETVFNERIPRAVIDKVTSRLAESGEESVKPNLKKRVLVRH